MKRLGGIPEYRGMFEAAYPGTKFSDMTFAHASNAIAGFIVDRLTFDDTPWDRFLAGRDDALTPAQLDGAKTFLTLKCSICHNGRPSATSSSTTSLSRRSDRVRAMARRGETTSAGCA